MRGPPTAEQFTTRQRYRVPGIALPSRRTGATHKPYSPSMAASVFGGDIDLSPRFDITVSSSPTWRVSDLLT